MDVLKAVKEGVAGPTQIMYKANLSWIALQSHLKVLVMNELLNWVENGNRKKYELTEKGLSVMKKYCDLLNQVNQNDESHDEEDVY